MASFRQFLQLVDDVVTLPRRGAIVWSHRPSILAAVTFTSLAIGRFFSPLQWLKWAFRRKALVAPKGRLQHRPDFHALYSELYFFGVCALLWAATFLPDDSIYRVIKSGIGWLFFFEIVVWTIYYGTLRGFIERSYSIYHRTEYLLMVPLAFVVCAGSYALATSDSFASAARFFMGIGTETHAHAIVGTAVNILFFAVVMSYLIAQFPAARVKADDVDQLGRELTIIGAGDVIETRAWPAATKVGYDASRIAILALGPRPSWMPPSPNPPQYIQVNSDLAATAREAVKAGRPILIATPTNTHVELINAIRVAAEEWVASRRSIPLIVEKPLCGPGQYQQLQKAIEDYGVRNLFSLSYYLIEKALPLTALLTGNTIYLRYVVVNSGLRSWGQVQDAIRQLGPLKRIRGRLREDQARSPAMNRLWVLDPAHGGIVYEQTIHLLLLAQLATTHASGNSRGMLDAKPLVEMFCDAATPAAAKQWPTAARLAFDVDEIHVEVASAKFIPSNAKKRSMKLTYEHGSIDCDFDARTARVFHGQDQVIEVGIRPEFADNYATQMDLALRCVEGGDWSWNRSDGIAYQLAVLAWLDRFVNAQIAAPLPIASSVLPGWLTD